MRPRLPLRACAASLESTLLLPDMSTRHGVDLSMTKIRLLRISAGLTPMVFAASSTVKIVLSTIRILMSFAPRESRAERTLSVGFMVVKIPP